MAIAFAIDSILKDDPIIFHLSDAGQAFDGDAQVLERLPASFKGFFNQSADSNHLRPG